VKYFDKLETRAPRARENALMAALPGLILHAKKRAPGFAKILKDVSPVKVKSREALSKLPVTRKSDLGRLQKERPPLGGLNAAPLERLAKLFISPGPIYDPEGRGKNWWRTARGLFAGGFRAGDCVMNSFAYHFTPAGSMAESGALALGCTVVPTGVGQTEMQAAAIQGLGITGYIGTPSFLKMIVEKADELKIDISSLNKAQVGAEYLRPPVRKAMQERGIAVTQMYASADLGLIAYESLMPDGALTDGMILEEGLLLEIVRPGTGDPVKAGEVGEVVITSSHAISSAPMRELAARLYPLPVSTIEASRLKYRDFLTVALMIRSDDLFPDNWIYIHDSKVQVGRVQNFRSWSPEMVPDAGVACVGLEYFCFEGDGLWSMHDDKLVELAKREMNILGLVAPEKVIGGVVVRQEKAYPVYDAAYAANVAAMRTELEAQHPTLHLVGRNGMHRYNNQDHAMMTAMLTVENILAGERRYDTWCVNEDAEYHEAGAEGADKTLPAREPVSEDQAAALGSVREVPQRIAAGARKAA
jgi:hypothetical protein